MHRIFPKAGIFPGNSARWRTTRHFRTNTHKGP
jgi:hypothetical protein